MRITKTHLVLGSLASIELLTAVQVRADDKLEQVIVTARRTLEGVQSVPVSITAINSEAINDKTVINLGDLGRLTPGLFYTPFGAGNNAPSLRGAGTIGAGDVVRPVVTYFAEVPISNVSGTPPVFDLANIQILKGPQGTLFGRNAFAGAVLITPNEAGFNHNGYLKLSAGNFAYTSAEGAVNIPLVDNKLAVRLSGLYQRRDGYTENISGADADDLDEKNFRLNVLFEPTENLRITELIDYRKSETGGQGSINLGMDPKIVGLLPLIAPVIYGCASGDPSCNLPAAVAQSQRLGPRKVNYAFDPKQVLEGWGSTTKVEYVIGDITLTNILGFRHSESQGDSPIDGLGLSVPVFASFSADDIDQWTEEFHVDGTSFDDRLTWIAGTFYSHTESSTAGTLAFTPALGGSATPYSSAFRTNENEAVFGQITWDFSEQLEGLTLDLGYRYNHDDKTACGASNLASPNFATFDPTNPDFNPMNPGSGLVAQFSPGVSNRLAGSSDCGPDRHYKDGASTWTVALNYKITPDLLTYITSRRGYREGSMNMPDLSSSFLGAYQDAGPEKATDLEIGLKSDWRVGDVRGRFNIDAYVEWYKDTQVAIPTTLLSQPNTVGGKCDFTDPANPTGQYCITTAQQPSGTSVNINLGKQRVSGVEAEFMVQPVRDLTISAGLAYTHLDKTDFTVPAWASTPPISIFSPEWAYNAAITYILPFHPLDGELVFNADYTYSDKILAFGTSYTPAWDQTNVRIDWRNAGMQGLTVSAFVTNVFDQENIIALSGNGGIEFGFYNPPRMFGGELKWDF